MREGHEKCMYLLKIVSFPGEDKGPLIITRNGWSERWLFNVLFKQYSGEYELQATDFQNSLLAKSFWAKHCCFLQQISTAFGVSLKWVKPLILWFNLNSLLSFQSSPNFHKCSANREKGSYKKSLVFLCLRY